MKRLPGRRPPGGFRSGRGQTRPRIETGRRSGVAAGRRVAAGVKPGRGLKPRPRSPAAACRRVAAGVKPGRGLKLLELPFTAYWNDVAAGVKPGRGLKPLYPPGFFAPARCSGRGQTRPRIETASLSSTRLPRWIVAAGVKPGRGLKLPRADPRILQPLVAAGVKPGRGLKRGVAVENLVLDTRSGRRGRGTDLKT